MNRSHPCPTCGETVDAAWSFCRACGAERDEAWPATERAVALLEATEVEGTTLPGGDQVTWSVGGAMMVFLISIFVTAIVATILATSAGEDPTPTQLDTMTAIGLVANQVALFGAAWFWIRREGRTLGAFGFTRPDGRLIGIGVGVGLFGVFLSAIVSVAARWLSEVISGNPPTDPRQIPLESSPQGALLVALAISTIILAPLAEETFFRGMLHQAIRRRMPLMSGILLSSAAFAAVHVIPLVIPSIFVLAILLAFMFEKERSLWVPIVAHATFNLVGFWASYLS